MFGVDEANLGNSLEEEELLEDSGRLISWSGERHNDVGFRLAPEDLCNAF